MALELISSSKSFGGFQKIFKHSSKETGCSMTFAAYIPPQVAAAADGDTSKKFPVLYWLSGLTCTEKNFIEKSGFQRFAAEAGIVVIGPDTSPRGCNIEGEEDAYDFGTGAGFYVDATEEKWKKNYRMYSYVTKELPVVVAANFPVDPSRQSIFGHSAGGHGALICFLKNPGQYRSVSAFAPISNPSVAPWGIKAFTGYLGSNQDAWKQYDATHLIGQYTGEKVEILIDQGGADDNKANQLLPQNFEEAAKIAGHPLRYRDQEGYDHGYYFVASFIGDHFKHHAKFLA
ncbi:S-formylglutathione hydrolase [Hypsibius exemplaris]|uniref:S-formylglutathione hydrolase n=1 Tax=Hypsibius exemplaris TaxID=2072580 RepID=A0A9X6NHA8_HYPEX|nr:S-formylglutathione hydrolase [Hypsibius exemplaris]